MKKIKVTVKGLFLGKAKTLSNGIESGIHKDSQEKIEVKKTHLPNDAVLDTKHHGGDMRVIHHYTEVNYGHLKQIFPNIADKFKPGTIGENLYTEELTEADLCVGDIFTLGEIKIQLTTTRMPCATINHGYEDNRVLKEVLNSNHFGWFYRVLEEGSVKLGDELELIERPYPHLTLLKLNTLGYTAPRFSDKKLMQEYFDTGLMCKGWKPRIEKALGVK